MTAAARAEPKFTSAIDTQQKPHTTVTHFLPCLAVATQHKQTIYKARMATDNGQWLVACLAYGLMRRLMSCCEGAGVEVLSRGKGRVGTWLPPALPLHVPFPLSSPFCSRCFYYILQLLRLRTGVMHVMATISSSHPCGKRWREIGGGKVQEGCEFSR